MKNTERMIHDFYLSIGVDKLDCFNMFYISEALDLTLYFDNQHSKIYLNHTMKLLIIDNRLNQHTQQEDFFHLLAKYLIYDHHLVAEKVEELTLHLAIPQHLLVGVELSSDTLSQHFNVTPNFASKRIKQMITKGFDEDERFCL